MYYNRNRYYSPDTGRYITLDPIKLAGGLNSYQYCPDPINWVDPLGLNACPPDSDDISVTPESKATVNTGEPSTPNADNPKRNLTSEERMALIDERAEANAKVQVMKQQDDYNKNITDPNLKAHHDRHSADVTDAKLEQRAIDGTLPDTGITPRSRRGNPSSQFTSWRMQMHVLNDAKTRTIRGKTQYTGRDNRNNPIVQDKIPEGLGQGRGYRPNRGDPNNPTVNETMENYQVKYDSTTNKPFSSYPED